MRSVCQGLCNLIAPAAILIAGQFAKAVPLDNKFSPAKVNLSGDLPAKYDISVDAQDGNIFYVAPTSGKLAENRGMPALSFATAERSGTTYGVLNAVFRFHIDPDEFEQIRTEIRDEYPDAKIRPLTFSHTVPELAIAGMGDSETCFEAPDFVTGEPITQCLQMVYRKKISRHGPQLGEEMGVSLVLSPAGVDIVPKLLRGGAGIMVNLEGIYYAALPGFKAIIEADYKKLYESYAYYAGYHDGVCTDIAVSDFFEKEVACTSNMQSMNGNPCSIKITYVDTLGQEHNNLFDIMPDPSEPTEVKAWYAQHKNRIDILWTAIDGLRKDFEKKFLQPINGKRAEVSKEPTMGFALRIDRSRSEASGSYRFERDILQSVGMKRKQVYGYSICVDTNGETGAVSRSMIGQCPQYWNGQIDEGTMLPVIGQFDAESNRNATPVVGSIDWG